MNKKLSPEEARKIERDPGAAGEHFLRDLLASGQVTTERGGVDKEGNVHVRVRDAAGKVFFEVRVPLPLFEANEEYKRRIERMSPEEIVAERSDVQDAFVDALEQEYQKYFAEERLH